MNINQLLDEWNDPIKDLYLREVNVLLKGLSFLPKSIENLKEILNKVYTTDLPHSRSSLHLIVGYSNLTLFTEETIVVEALHQSSLKKQKFTYNLKHIKKFTEDICKDIDLFLKFNDQSITDYKIKILLLEKCDKRNDYENKQWHIFDTEQWVKVMIASIKLYNLDHSVLEKLHSFINEKDVIKIFLLQEEINNTLDKLNYPNSKISVNISNQYKNLLNHIKLKDSYLSMLEESQY